MKVIDFQKMVNEDPDLEGVGVNDEDSDNVKFVIRHLPSKLKTAVELTGVVKNEWDVLNSILKGEREPDPLSHMTRVVGYFSETSNWNKSKMGELADRRKGNYQV